MWNLKSRYSNVALQIGLILIVLLVYLRTLLPGTGYHPDSAKFQFVGYVLGTPHAPGYPTYVILNHLFTHAFPWGTLAYRANLLSAIFAIAACLVLFRILKLLHLSSGLAFVVTLSFALSPTFWSQAIVAEVYTLNALFVSLVLYFMLAWYQTLKLRYLLSGTALYAISFGNHLTMITLLPALLYLVWSRDRAIFKNAKIVAIILLFILVGALQYAYPIWRYNDPHTLYLDMQTPGLHRLLYAVTGGHFKPRMFAFTVGEIFDGRIPMFLKLLWREYLFLLPLIFYGIFRTSNRVINTCLLLMIAGNLFFCLNYDIPDIFVFFIPLYMILAIYLGIGLKFVSENFRPLRVAPFLFVIFPVLLFALNYFQVDQHQNRSAERALHILKAAGENAVVFGGGQDLPRLYFFYYLYGENLYHRQLYVVRYTPQFVNSYMIRKRPFYYRELRKHVPPGLDVYCTTVGQRDALQHVGFELIEIEKGLYKVASVPDHPAPTS